MLHHRLRAAAGGRQSGWLPTDFTDLIAWYDPSDLATMWQDTAGTIPVTASGQSVARIDDKSGNGYHATQSTLGLRPLYETAGGLHWLRFDGVNDRLQTGSINLTTRSEIGVFAGIMKSSDAASAMVAEFGPDIATTSRAFALFAPAGGGASKYFFTSRGTSSQQEALTTDAAYTAPHTAVVTGQASLTAPSVALRVNGLLVDQNNDPQGTGTYSTQNLYIGRRPANFAAFTGNLYSLFIRAGLTAGADLISAESWVNSKTGAY